MQNGKDKMIESIRIRLMRLKSQFIGIKILRNKSLLLCIIYYLRIISNHKCETFTV